MVSENAGDKRAANIFNYRSYVSMDVEYSPEKTPEGEARKWRKADDTQKNDSGGQQGILQYSLRVAVMDYQVFTDKPLRLLITDETGANMDDDYARDFIRMLDSLKMSYIVCSHRPMYGNFTKMAYMCNKDDEKEKYMLSRVDAAKEVSTDDLQELMKS
jgi:hypothetical protein